MPATRTPAAPAETTTRLGGADVYRLACHELCVQPDEALLAALEGQVGWEEGFEGEEGAVTVTMRGLDEPHLCALALTLSHLTQQQAHGSPQQAPPATKHDARRLHPRSPTGCGGGGAGGPLRLRLCLPGCAPGREGMRQLGMAVAESDAVVGLSFAPSPALGADEEILLLLAGELRQASSACALRELSLAGSGPLTARHVDALAAALLCLPHPLTLLDLANTHLDPTTLVLLGRLLRRRHHHHRGGGLPGWGGLRLSLARNPRLRDEGAAVVGGALAARLPPPPPAPDDASSHWALHLRTLDLSQTNLGDEGLRRLVDGVAAYIDHHQHHQHHNPSLLRLPRQLALDGNPALTPGGVARHLGRLLRLYGGGAPSPCCRLHLSLAGNDGLTAGAAAWAALAEAAAEAGGGALASLSLEGSPLDAAAVRALAGLVAAATGLEALSLTLPPLPPPSPPPSASSTSSTTTTDDALQHLSSALEALLDAAAASLSLRRLGLEGPRGYLTDGVVAAIVRAERAFARNRARAAAGVGVEVGVEGDGRREPTLSELVLSVLFENRGGLLGEDECGGGKEEEKEDVATTVAILRRRLRSLEAVREEEQLDAAILAKVLALLLED